MTDEKLKIGVSSCLLGEKVRHDGGHKKNAYLLNILAPYVDFVPCCPEVSIGLGVPRPTIRLVGEPDAPRLVHVKDESMDITEKMQNFANKKMQQVANLDAYILKVTIHQLLPQ